MIFMRPIAKATIFLSQGAPAENIFVLSPLKCPMHIPLVFINVAPRNALPHIRQPGTAWENSLSFEQKRLIISYKESLRMSF